MNPDKTKLALAIGVFDGVHLGHRRILDALIRLAAETGAEPAAMTFDPHPRAVLHPEQPPILLVPLRERLRLLQEAGAKRVEVVPFTPEFAALEPGQFLDRLLQSPAYTLTGITVGQNWRFGRMGGGNSAYLDQYAREHGLRFEAVPELELDGSVVSSSAIRRAIASGRLDEAKRLLGRSYRLVGPVVYGHGAASTRLACPTANVAADAGVLPPDGVYAGIAWHDGKPHAAAINVGVSPTFGWEGAPRRLEVHFLDFTGNLYGTELGVEFRAYLREERSYPSPEALKSQIEQDIRAIRRLLA